MNAKYSQYSGHKDSINCILNHPLGLFTGSDDKTVRLWDIRVPHAVKCICGDIYDGVSCLSAFPGDDNLICVGFDTVCLVYDMRKPGILVKEVSRAVNLCRDCVNCIQPVTTKESTYLAMCDDAGYGWMNDWDRRDVILYDTKQEDNSNTFEEMHSSVCTSLLVYYANDAWVAYL